MPPSLPELQRAFAAAVLEDAPALLTHVRPRGETANDLLGGSQA